MVGVYPTYVLRSGAFLAEPFFFAKSLPIFIKSVIWNVFYYKTFLFIIKRPDPGGFARLMAVSEVKR